MLFGGLAMNETAYFTMKNIFEIIAGWGYEPVQVLLLVCAVFLGIIALRSRKK